jgi:PAS domain S-box-containing protein
MEVDLSPVLDELPAMVWTAAPDGKTDFVNQRWSDYTGLSLGDADGWKWQSVVQTEDLAPLLERWRSILASGQPGEMEARIRRFDGEYRRFLVQTNPIRNDRGQIVKWCGVSIDVEDRRRAEDDLRASERGQILDGMPGLVAVFTPNGEVEGVNRRVLDYFGMTFEELKNWGTSDAIHPEDLPHCIEAFTNAIASGNPFEWECRARRFDGAYRWFQSRGYPFRDSSGRIVRWYNLLIDIDDRKCAEERLRRNEAFLAKGESASLTGTFSWDFATGLFTWSKELYRIYEFDPANPVTFELIATRYHPEDKAVIARVAEWARGGGVPNFDYRHRLLMPNGSIKHIHVVAHRNRNEDGRVEYFGAVQDVTQRHLADEARRLSEGRWKRIVDNSAIGIVVADLEGRFEIANAAFQKLIGFTEEELKEMNFLDVTEPQFRDQNFTLTAELLRGMRDQFNIEKQYRCKDGRLVWVRNNVSLLPGADGTPRNIMAIIEDISSRKAAEGSLRVTYARLARAAELATAAELSASIAHEINQPLSGIITNTNTCLRMLGTDPPNIDGARETARRTLRDGNRASEVVIRLRALFNKKPPILDSIDLNGAAREVITLLSNGIQANHVVLRTEFADDLPSVKGDRVQLQQVILNLIQNAIDSMTAVDGRIRQLQIKTKRDEGHHVRLTIKDTGIGLAPDAVERMFESFYTTKGHGMGIGLAISRSIIEGHEGRLWAETNDGPGVTFSFSIPAFGNPVRVSGLDAVRPAVGVDSRDNQHEI